MPRFETPHFQTGTRITVASGHSNILACCQCQTRLWGIMPIYICRYVSTIRKLTFYDTQRHGQCQVGLILTYNENKMAKEFLKETN